MYFQQLSHFKNYILLIFVSSLIQESLLYNTLNLGQPRLSQAEGSRYDLRDHEGPGTYAFGYDIDDAATGNTQFREEERHKNGTVTGSYGYVEPDGNVHTVYYIADEMGYRVRIENSRDKLTPPPVASPKNPILNRRPVIANYPGYYNNNNRYTVPYYNTVAVSKPTPIARNPVIFAPSTDLELPVRDYNPNFEPDLKYYVKPIVPQTVPQYVRDRNGVYFYTQRY